MSNIPSESELSKMMKNYVRESVEDDIDREMIAMLDAEDDAAAQTSQRRRASHRKYIDRERESGHDRLFRDYFSNDSIFGDNLFRRRFRMRKHVFMRIVADLGKHSRYFTLRSDATGRKGLSPLQKCTAAIRQLAYVAPGDSLDEYMRMGESTALEVLHKFCSNVVEVYQSRYLRRPDVADTQRLLKMHEERHGFPGMLGSLDCMHWEWRNCPVAWKGQYTRGDHGVPTIVLEAVASADLWIWHAFFGVAGANNDINVLHGSPLFDAALYGNAPPIEFTINGNKYNRGYYLTDGIYPKWASFVKSYVVPEDPIRKKFKERQEAARKDVERAFGVLQQRWAIVRGPARSYFKQDLQNIIFACIIMHNMIIEDEGEAEVDWFDEDTPPPQPHAMGPDSSFDTYLRNYHNLRDSDAHNQLQSDLIKHIWEQYISRA